MNSMEVRVSAIVQELANQRSALGERAANMAADLAEALAENAELKKRIAELEKPKADSA